MKLNGDEKAEVLESRPDWHYSARQAKLHRVDSGSLDGTSEWSRDASC